MSYMTFLEGAMLDKTKVRRLIAEHYHRYPNMQITDYFKLLYHSALGCEHAISSFERAMGYLLSEIDRVDMDSEILIESLGFGYSRVHLAYLSKGLLPETLVKLFFLSAGCESKGSIWLIESVEILRAMARAGEIGVSFDELNAAIDEWRSLGYPAVHHSEIYRQSYNPTYRVIYDRYVALLPTFTAIDIALAEGREIDLTSMSGGAYEIIAEVYEGRIPKK